MHNYKLYLLIKLDREKDSVSFRSSTAPLHSYNPSSSSLRYENCKVLIWLVPLETVGVIVSLLLFVIGPVGPFQVMFTAEGFTPLSVPITHWISLESPTDIFSSEVLTVVLGMGAVNY